MCNTLAIYFQIFRNFGYKKLKNLDFNEKTLNKENYPAAVSLLGGKDDESVDLFWAKKN